MRVIIISRDPALLETGKQNSETVVRHQAYARRVEALIIIVFSKHHHPPVTLVSNCTVYAVTPFDVVLFWRYRALLRRIFGGHEFHLVVSQDPHAAGIVAWLTAHVTRAPLIVHMHGDFLSNPHWRRERPLHRVWAVTQFFILRRAAAIRVVSKALKDKLLSRGFAETKLVVINTPVNDQLFLKQTEEQVHTLDELKKQYGGRRVLLCVGRLVAAKNLDFTLTVVDALRKQNPSVLLLIIGDGELRYHLAEQIQTRKLTDHVLLAGLVSPAELGPYYRLSEVLLFLSTNESFGKVIIEAGLCGVPALASTTSGATSVITDGDTGFIVPINDFHSTVDMLNEMLAYPNETRGLGARAREAYQHQYGFEQTVEAIVSLWQNVARV